MINILTKVTKQITTEEYVNILKDGLRMNEHPLPKYKPGDLVRIKPRSIFLSISTPPTYVGLIYGVSWARPMPNSAGVTGMSIVGGGENGGWRYTVTYLSENSFSIDGTDIHETEIEGLYE